MNDAAPARPQTAGRAIGLLAVAAFASAATTRICDGLLPQLAGMRVASVRPGAEGKSEVETKPATRKTRAIIGAPDRTGITGCR